MLTYDDGSTSAQYTYDALNRKIAETVNYGSFSLSYSYTYTSNGLKKSFTGPDGIKYEYTYDAGGRIKSIHIPGKGSITYNEYTWNKPKTVSLPGGTVKNYTYDPLQRYTEIKSDDQNDSTLMDYDYASDKMDNILIKNTEQGNYSYNYDDIYQLTAADNPGADDETYTYDAAGNRVTASGTPGTWTFNQNNELIRYGDVSFEYDANGNMIKKTQGSQVTNYFYDGDDRLVRIEDGAGSVIAQYYYDPFGRRLWKDVSGTRTCFAYAEEGLIGEYNAAGSQLKAYGYRPGSLWTTDPLFMKAGSQYYFYHNDHLGTPQKMTDMNGTIVWSASYTSFGKATIDPASTIINNLRFPGQYYDAETGLCNNYNRYYSQEIGAYIIRDPMIEMALVIAYAYSENNPINKMDPLGLADCIRHDSIWPGSCIWDKILYPVFPVTNLVHFAGVGFARTFLDISANYLAPIPIIGNLAFSLAVHIYVDTLVHTQIYKDNYTNLGFYGVHGVNIGGKVFFGTYDTDERFANSSYDQSKVINDSFLVEAISNYNSNTWTSYFDTNSLYGGNHGSNHNLTDYNFSIMYESIQVWAIKGTPTNIDTWAGGLGDVIKSRCTF